MLVRALAPFRETQKAMRKTKPPRMLPGLLRLHLLLARHSFTASFGGDPSYSPSNDTSTPLAFTVLQAPTTTVRNAPALQL